MSRLYLILFLFFSGSFIGQAKLKQYLDFADKQVAKGDLIYALEYYKKAMDIDSNSVTTLWSVATTLEAYKDYPNAAYYFKKVYDRENGKLFPNSILKHALMLKQANKYKEALEVLKFCKKKYTKKSDYNYLKSKRELESTLWAIQLEKDSLKLVINPLPETVNTQNSEFGHAFKNNKLYFSSLQPQTINDNEEIIDPNYKTKLYTSNLKDSIFQSSEILKECAYANLNSGNGSFNSSGTQFYFSICGEQAYNYRCKIAVAKINEKGEISEIDTLGEIINEEYANTTMPHLGTMNGEEVLFFASDRKGGLGGMDIYFSAIKNGQQFSKVINLDKVNSPDNELTPFWDNSKQVLYFSSSWHNGYGGQDVHSIQLLNYTFQNLQNAGKPINSCANDLYFFKHKDSSFVTSNRIGVQFSINPTCCSDIFLLQPIPITAPLISTITEKDSINKLDTISEDLTTLMKRLPVTLYFHNDEPTPKVLDTTTILSYSESYFAYTAMLEQYKTEYSKGLNDAKALESKEDIESFFQEFVDYGYNNLVLFTKALLIELEKGSKIKITVKGFASPLAKTAYNVNLTKRRISSLKNELARFQDGKLAPYLNNSAANGGRIEITQEPFGEYKANQLISDNPNDTKNSVYSRGAAVERKIEIISINLISE